MNLSEMITLVRIDLKDNTAPYRWSDDELARHIVRAVKDFSEAVPYEQIATLATIAGSREISLSGLIELVMVRALEFPIDKSPPQMQEFSLWANTVTLSGENLPDGSDARIYYGILHNLDAASSTIPAKHEDLIAAGAAGYAAVELSAFSINRINLGTAVPEEFLKWGTGRLDYFQKELNKLGRRNKVEVRHLYSP